MTSFLISLVAVFLIGTVQAADIFIFGVKPNLILPVVLTALMIFSDWRQRVALILVAALSIQTSQGIGWDVVLPGLILGLGIMFIELAPARRIVSFLVTIVAGTLALSISNFDLVTFGLEALYNLTLALALYSLAEKRDLIKE